MTHLPHPDLPLFAPALCREGADSLSGSAASRCVDRGDPGSGRSPGAMAFMNQSEAVFDGETFSPSRDGPRLTTLLSRVRAYLADGEWRTLREIQAACGGSESSVSARLRDLRKPRFGGHNIARENVNAGLWRYRLRSAQVN